MSKRYAVEGEELKRRKKRQLWKKAVLGDMDALAIVGAMLYRGGRKKQKIWKGVYKKSYGYGK